MAVSSVTCSRNGFCAMRWCALRKTLFLDASAGLLSAGVFSPSDDGTRKGSIGLGRCERDAAVEEASDTVSEWSSAGDGGWLYTHGRRRSQGSAGVQL